VIADHTEIKISPDTELCSFDISNLYISSDEYAQSFMGNVIIIPSEELEHL
jgi:hypothetical protein